MTKCELCKKRWPDHLVRTLLTSRGGISVDPICGLKQMRKIHGDQSLEFSGENSIALYREALAYKRQKEAT